MLDPLLPLVQFVLPAIVGLFVGGIVGAILARKGVRAATALKGHQPLAWILLAACGLVVWSFYKGLPQDALPASIQPHVELILRPGATALASVVVAFLFVLERAAWREPGKRRPLILGLSVGLVLLCYLGWLSLPVRPTEDLAADGVVFQTTPFTCAAASIATIARATGVSPGLTEGAAAAAAQSTFGGTLTTGELRALRELGFVARYGRGLSLDSLIAHGGPGILHVSEPVPGGRRIRHSVALLSVDTASGFITIGNPLEGRQRIAFEALGSYWIGEAILVSVAHP